MRERFLTPAKNDLDKKLWKGYRGPLTFVVWIVLRDLSKSSQQPSKVIVKGGTDLVMLTSARTKGRKRSV